MRNIRLMPISGRTGALRSMLVITAASLSLAGCGGGSMFGGGSPSSGGGSPSMTDRFTQLFSGKSTEVGAPQSPQTDENDLTCPSVSIRPGASTYAVGAAGKPAVGNDLAFQATITRTARSCDLNAGQISVKIGIQGRVIVGPAGAPAAVDVPLRVAVVQEGVTPKTIATKVFQTNVQIGSETSVPFSLVGEDLVYPAPTGTAGDSYIFYIGFDPQALKPEPRARKKR
ncbi:hypothetical protein [Tardiphaga sp.]|uniref:hypothetical protein n=1 Tax=Tardiphaga sp. TaxID=1926292 RepID=UPI00352BB13C